MGKYRLDLEGMKIGVVMFLFGFVIFLFIIFNIYLQFTIDGKVKQYWIMGGYADFVLMLIGIVFIANSFKKEEYDLSNRIAELNTALSKGLISEEDYTKLKDEILKKY